MPTGSNNKKFPAYQIEQAHQSLIDVISMLDTEALTDLFEGYSYDVDKLIKTFTEETAAVHLFNKEGVDHEAFGYMDNLINSYENSLRRTSLNYFVATALDSFDLSYHTIEWFNLIQTYPYLAVLSARGHGKSYAFSFAYPLWQLFRYNRALGDANPHLGMHLIKEGMIVTNKNGLAESFVKRIGNEVLDNPILAETMRPMNSGGFKAGEVSLKSGAKLNISSFYTSNRGPHPGWIVVDDFLDRSAIYSQTQRNKFNEVFYGEVLPMLRANGAITVTGTPFHQKDLYANFKDRNKRGRFKLFEYPAIFPDGSLLWKEEYDFQWLMEQKQMQGELIFTREFLVKPISDDSSIFPWSTLKLAFIGVESSTLIDNIAFAKEEYVSVGVGVDFAISQNISADNTVIVVLGLTKAGTMHLLHIRVLHGASANEQVANIIQVNQNFKPRKILCEENGFQKILVDELKDRGLRNVEGWTTTGFNKKDLYNGLPSLAILFEQHKLKFPRGDERSKNETDMVCNELNSVSFIEDTSKLESVGGHDDRAMALFFAVQAVKKLNSGLNISFI